MQKRKVSFTFKRENVLDNQERIYPCSLIGNRQSSNERERARRPRSQARLKFCKYRPVSDGVSQERTPRPTP